jgi:hypothetical protein
VIRHLERRGVDCPKTLVATHFHELFSLQLLQESNITTFWVRTQHQHKCAHPKSSSPAMLTRLFAASCLDVHSPFARAQKMDFLEQEATDDIGTLSDDAGRASSSLSQRGKSSSASIESRDQRHRRFDSRNGERSDSDTSASRVRGQRPPQIVCL